MIKEGIICTRCAHTLELEDIIEGDAEYGDTYMFECPHCGARYECTEVPQSERGNSMISIRMVRRAYQCVLVNQI